MRSRSVIALLSLVLVAPPGGGLSAQGRGQDTRPGIAVLPFDNGGSYGQDKENFDALQKGIAGMLISELSANPAARVVEREEIQKLLEEQNLGASGRVDPQTAAKVGRLVGARLMKDANLPPLPKQASDQRLSRQIPTEALTYYSRALLYQDRGQRDKATEMYQKALAVFPDYTEAQQGLQRVKSS